MAEDICGDRNRRDLPHSSPNVDVRLRKSLLDPLGSKGTDPVSQRYGKVSHKDDKEERNCRSSPVRHSENFEAGDSMPERLPHRGSFVLGKTGTGKSVIQIRLRDDQLAERRKVIKMLVYCVILFFICYTPWTVFNYLW